MQGYYYLLTTSPNTCTCNNWFSPCRNVGDKNSDDCHFTVENLGHVEVKQAAEGEAGRCLCWDVNPEMPS